MIQILHTSYLFLGYLHHNQRNIIILGVSADEGVNFIFYHLYQILGRLMFNIILYIYQAP